jgi:CBS-domain-containing membrane protein
MRDFRPLPAHALGAHTSVCRPDAPKPVTIDSFALEVMTDLQRVYAAVIEPQESMEAAKQYMIQRGVRLLLVLGQEKNLLGLITANDIQGEKPMRVVQERGIRHSEIIVSDVMTPLDRVQAIPIEEARSAKVGHVIASLKSAGRQHALVVETASSSHTAVRGIFSLSQIARQLGVPIQTTEVAKTFAEIEVMLMANSAFG